MKAAIYARYSTDKQSSTSISAQVHLCTQYCKDRNIDIHGVYIDEAETGTNADRYGFHELMSGAKERAFNAVVIYDVTRGSRDVGDWFSFRKTMMMHGVKVISATEDLGDITNPNDFLRELITVGMGQHTVLQTRQKSRESINLRAASGKFCGGYAPLGYNIVDGNYVINEKESLAVRLIFESYAAGKGYGYIIDKLAIMGVMSKRGQKIGENSVHQILKNERYIGRFSWNKRQVKFFSKWAGGKLNPDAVIIDDIIPRIIDNNLWERVEKRLMENKHNKQNKSSTNREYLLSGLLHCAKCGGAFVGSTNMCKTCEYSFYSCVTKRRLHTCSAKTLPANDIEPLIVSLIKNDILNGDFIEKTADAILKSTNEYGNTKNNFDKEISDINKKISNLLKVLADGFDSDSVRQSLMEHEAQKKVLEQQKTSFTAPMLPSRTELIKSLREDSIRAIANPSCMRELIQKYIVRIDVDDDMITIYAVKDLSSPSSYMLDDKKEQRLEDNSKALNTAGCGGGI